MTKRQASEKPILVLVEDYEERRNEVLEYIRETYSAESRGVGSVEELRSLFKGPDDSLRPDLAIHDCKILRKKDSVEDTMHAGATAYAILLRKGIPVVVLTSLSKDDVLSREPYRSNPPIEILEKRPGPEKSEDGSIRWAEIDAAVEAFRVWSGEEST